MDIETEEYHREFRRFKFYLERKGLELPVERVEAREATNEASPPTSRVDPGTGKLIETVTFPISLSLSSRLIDWIQFKLD